MKNGIEYLGPDVAFGAYDTDQKSAVQVLASEGGTYKNTMNCSPDPATRGRFKSVAKIDNKRIWNERSRDPFLGFCVLRVQHLKSFCLFHRPKLQ